MEEPWTGAHLTAREVNHSSIIGEEMVGSTLTTFTDILVKLLATKLITIIIQRTKRTLQCPGDRTNRRRRPRQFTSILLLTAKNLDPPLFSMPNGEVSALNRKRGCTVAHCPKKNKERKEPTI